MFAVPGWSVSAANLKAESASQGPKGDSSNQDADAKSKKRKRPSGPPAVTSANVSDLWERVIEGKRVKKPRADSADQKDPKKPKQGPDGVISEDGNVLEGDRARDGAKKGAQAASKGGPGVTKKEKKKQKKAKETRPDGQEDGESKTETTQSKNPNSALTKGSKQVAVAAPAPPPAPKLTPLQAAMREKLISARFRHLNETLYTKPSVDALQLFEESPEMFNEYHEGFRRQVDVWPENPVDGYIEEIKLRGKVKQAPRDQSAKTNSKGPRPPKSPLATSTGGVVPFPRTREVCTIADLGCGDAKLAQALQSHKNLGLNILSYDLQSPNPLVTKADIANLPEHDGSVNVVIFCLALMGTNWLDFIEEAYRILHWKGELWIAEIKSRFAPVIKGKKGGVVSHSVGNRKKLGKKGKGGKDEPEESHDAELMVEVDGGDDRRQETDVSAFVEALRKRGFVLQGDVDLSNKMFVKMRFLKNTQPVVGKGVVEQRDSGRGGAYKKPVKFLDPADQPKVDESSILKPCVYKLR